MNKNEVSVIIPAYQPDEKLMDTLKGLVKAGFSDILVVNDGSGQEYTNIFENVKSIKGCTILEHPVNCGKGAALKTAFTYFLRNRPDKSCVVTADADGQHLVKDIEAVAIEALESGRVILGVRDFSDTRVPARSKVGNRITSVVFKLFFGMKIEDTQTGLRAFPKEYLPELLKAEGERYEYETNMLFLINRRDIPYGQVKIETVYIEENKSSHFRVVRDSLRIYTLILKYLFSSVAASVVDELAFFVLKKAAVLTFLPIPLTFSAAFIARAISSGMNYWMNANVVFKDNKSKMTFVKYYVLVVAQIAVSAALVFQVEAIAGITSPAVSTIIKAIIDTMLFFVSFRIQHKWVFNQNKTSRKERMQWKES